MGANDLAAAPDPHYGTGRRKRAVARVRLRPGSGQILVNGRELSEYFGRPVLERVAKTPLVITETEGRFDVIANVTGGRSSGQAGALRHGTARDMLQVAGEFRMPLKRSGFLTRLRRLTAR